MIINGFDELNTPKIEVEEPEEYFSKMDISDKHKGVKRRSSFLFRIIGYSA